MPKSKNLKYCRKKAGLTQQAFADEIGVSKATVIAWESKKTAIPAPAARRVAERFDIEYADFCDIDLEAHEKGFVPTAGEIESIMKFREISEETKVAIRAAINSAYERKEKA